MKLLLSKANFNLLQLCAGIVLIALVICATVLQAHHEPLPPFFELLATGAAGFLFGLPFVPHKHDPGDEPTADVPTDSTTTAD